MGKPMNSNLTNESSPASGDLPDGSDPIWGVDDEVTTQEWSKMDEDFTNAGYREGITAGKESALQEGFDDGFANVGAPLGREVGVLRGSANAVMCFLSASEARAGPPEAVERWRDEVRSIVGGLGRIHLADLAPRDVQAEEHAREHLANDASGEVQITVAGQTSGGDSQDVKYRLPSSSDESLTPRPAVEELKKLRTRLSNILQALELEATLT